MNNTLCYNLTVLWQVFIFIDTLVVMQEEENSKCHHENVWNHSDTAPGICPSLIISSESWHAACPSHRNPHSDDKTNCRVLCFSDLSDSSKDVGCIQKFEHTHSNKQGLKNALANSSATGENFKLTENSIQQLPLHWFNYIFLISLFCS
jgi:hypothetical protein